MRSMSLTRRNLKEIFRDPITFLLGGAMPVLFLFLFSSMQNIGGGIDIFKPQMLTPGLIIFSFAFIIMFSGTLLGKDSKTAFLTRLMTTPLKPIDYFLAYMLPFLPLALFQLVVCYAAGMILGVTLTNIGLLLIIYFFMAIMCISIGVMMGSLLTLNQISGVGSLLITAVSLFSGAWMDLKMIGGIFEKVGYALPFAHSIDALKALSKGATFANIQTDFIWVLVYTLVFFGLAIFALKWKTRRV